MSFNEERFRCPWWQLKHQVQAGEAGKDEVVALLERQQAPPLELLPWLATVINGGQKFKRGVKDRPYRIRGAAARIAIAGMKAEGLPIKPVRGGSARDQIIQAVAGAFCCSTRTLERWIAEEVRLALEAAVATGNPIMDADALFESAREMAGIDDRIRNVQARLAAATGAEYEALAVEAESLVKQKIDLLNQRIESHQTAVAKLPEQHRDAPSFQQRLIELEAVRDDWLRFLS